jgi:hypothetical protein
MIASFSISKSQITTLSNFSLNLSLKKKETQVLAQPY